MCRLFGLSAGSERASATFWLIDAPDSLQEQSHREPDGTGLGWFERGGAPRIAKQAIAAFDDADFASEARTVVSPTFVGHVRFASNGGLTPENTHPFEQQGRLFAHNGVIGDVPALETELGDARALVQGETDSERFFALITRETAALDGEVSAGIASAARWIAASLPVYAINCVLITAGGLWALRYPDTHELHVLERSPGTALADRSSLGTSVRSDHGAARPLVVIASERMDDDPGWRALQSGELLHVSATLEVSSERILAEPPERRLTLQDLSPRAQASQAHPGGGGSG